MEGRLRGLLRQVAESADRPGGLSSFKRLAVSHQVSQVTAEEFSQFRHESVHGLSRLNDSCAKLFKISSWQRYDYDLDRGTLTFSQDGVPRVVASILVAGTISESGGTWLWSWANGYLPEPVSEPLKRVREFGASEGISELSEAYAPD